MNYYLTLGMVLFAFTGCTFQEPEERFLYPTMELTVDENITSAGIPVSAIHFNLADSQLVRYGFVWGKEDRLDLRTDNFIEAIPNLSTNQFSSILKYGHKAGRPVVIQSFLETDQYRLYSNPITVLSSGPVDPVITRITPDTAHRGELLTLFVENFSKPIEDNVVLFGEREGKVQSTTDSTILVEIPRGQPGSSHLIYLETLGARRVQAPGQFTYPDL